MALITAKALVGLIIAVIVVLVLWFVWNTVFNLLPDTVTADTQSMESFQRISNDINELSIKSKTSSTRTTYYVLDENNFVRYFKKGDSTSNIKKKNPSCDDRSCVCLCKDALCVDIIQCTIVNKELKNSGTIASGTGFLSIKYDGTDVSIEPKQK